MIMVNKLGGCVPHVQKQFDISDVEKSILELGQSLFESWNPLRPDLKFSQLTEGTTNSLLKVDYYSDGSTGPTSKRETVLIKVYGDGTDILIDREKEIKFHTILAQHRLAPPLLARFNNGHAYQFIPGQVCPNLGLQKEDIWRGVARTLAAWHTTLPVLPLNDSTTILPTNTSGLPDSLWRARPNVWVTCWKWLCAIPDDRLQGLNSVENLKKGFEYLVRRLVSNDTHKADKGFVFGHGDLLHGNIIMTPSAGPEEASDSIKVIAFIDYEHNTYCPPAFDLANHFAEWAGFECNYDLLPTASTRRNFIHEYVRENRRLAKSNDISIQNEDTTVTQLQKDVDNYRGFPGFYWGLCALIQAGATSGTIEFDYAGYAELRFAEFWAWKEEDDGSREHAGRPISAREKRLNEK